MNSHLNLIKEVNEFGMEVPATLALSVYDVIPGFPTNILSKSKLLNGIEISKYSYIHIEIFYIIKKSHYHFYILQHI